MADAATNERWYTMYSRLVESQLYKYGIEDIPDAAQDIWAAFVAGDYADIYTPSKGGELNFLVHFVERRCRSMRRKQEAARRSLHITDDSLVGAHEVSADSASLSSMDDVDLKLMVSSARDALYQLPIQGARDLGRLFDLLRVGFRQSEIAEVWGVSEGTVVNAMKELRRVPEVVALRDQLLVA
jgi:DNA-directed RNA polymerase specialized sigma24 family protein